MTGKHTVLVALLAGCAAPTRFVDRSILWRDPDDAPIRQPKTRGEGIKWTGFRDAIVFPADRALSLDYGDESWNVNALDEVPDSSWYVDLRRTSDAHLPPRAFTAEEMARGLFGDDPGPIAPFRVVKGKTIGSTPGLVVVDARGRKYMFKLDPPGWIGLNTSTEAVATRLAWAAGWLVPSEKIIDVRPEDLILDPKARTKNANDEDIPLTTAMLADLLRRTPREADGTVRACASVWLTGRNIGPWAYMGRRDDDANDRIDHQNRRDVRAFGVFAAWVNDIDTMENNTMDAYVGEDGHGNVVHYQQDVGGSFGQFAAVPAEVWMGDETFFQPGRILGSLFTFGAPIRDWEKKGDQRRDQMLRRYPELGYFDDQGFDPKEWHPVLDNPAFVRMTARDRYWGAKRVVAFSETEIRAAAALGHYAPATEQRLVEILLHRRERIARAFLAEVASLDYFRFEGQRLCYDDLWIRSGLEAGNSTRCTDVPHTNGYHVAQLSSRHQRTVAIHFVVARGAARVVGVER
jgi:hypothetical protein